MVLLSRRGVTSRQFDQECRDIHYVPTASKGIPTTFPSMLLRFFMLYEVMLLRPNVFRSTFGIRCVIQVLFRRGRILISHIPCVLFGNDLCVPIPLDIRVNVYRRMNFHLFLLFIPLDMQNSSKRRRNDYRRDGIWFRIYLVRCLVGG